MVCDPIFKLLRKNKPVKWNEKCQKAFDKIKKYLTSPPVLKPPRQGKPLILQLALEKNAMGAMLAHKGPEGIEHAVYYLSKKLLPYEEKYELVEQNEECQKFFDKIKEYLTNLPVLKPPRQGKPLILYLALEENVMGAMFA